MTRLGWQYQILSHDYHGTHQNEKEIEESMNEMGEKGWELVTACVNKQDEIIMMFKRASGEIIT